MTTINNTINNTQQFWDDLCTLVERSKAKHLEGDEPDAEVQKFLTAHRYLWPKIKADLDGTANDESYAWMSWMLARAICDASGCPHVEHVQRVCVLGDARGDGRESPPF